MAQVYAAKYLAKAALSAPRDLVNAYVATWNSFHEEKTGFDGTGGPSTWYESDLYGGVDVVAGPVTVGVVYTFYTYPNGAFETIQEIGRGGFPSGPAPASLRAMALYRSSVRSSPTYTQSRGLSSSCWISFWFSASSTVTVVSGIGEAKVGRAIRVPVTTMGSSLPSAPTGSASGWTRASRRLVSDSPVLNSRMPFVRAYPRESQEMVFDGHDRAFAFFKGACTRGMLPSPGSASGSGE